MNCLDALACLDAARPNGSDWDEPELREARCHLDECPDCSRVVSERHAWDQAFLNLAGPADSSSDCPDEFEARLLETMATRLAVEPATATSPATTTRRPVTRRQVATIAAAGLLAIGAGLWWQARQEVPVALTVDQIRNWPDERFSAVDDLEALAVLPEFIAAHGQVPMPTGWDRSWVRGPARGWPEDEQVAVMAFQVRLDGDSPIAGLLLAAPAGAMSSAPPVGDLTAARPRYSRSGRFSTTAWTDEATGTVFVCLVAPGEYEKLRRALVPRPV